MARAFRLAKAGQRVLLAPGDYDGQLLDDAVPRTGPPVTFEPAGGRATLRTLTVHAASNLRVRGLVVTGQLVVENEHPEREGATNVTLDRVTAKTLRLIGRISHITVRGGSYGNAVNGQPQIKKYNPTDPDVAAPTRILIDGASFHDFRRSDDSVHTECLQILNGNQVTIRNSRFWNCDGTGAIGVTPTGLIVGLTIENNFIAGGGDTGYGVQIGMLQRDFVFRYNSSSQSVFFADTKSAGPYTFIGNYMPYEYSLCVGSATYRNNVLAGGRCGSSDTEVPALRFVDERSHDLHLAPASGAIGRGDKDNRPRLDIDGDARPGRFAPDAGADQRESARIVLTRSIGEVVLGASEKSVTDFYGRGRAGTAKLGGVRVKRLTYRLRGGTLWTYADKGIVVGVATSSGYYQTASGTGPGTPLTGAALRGFAWDECSDAYSRTYGRVGVRTVPSARRRGAVIRTISLALRAYARCSNPG
jgi:hypothetical protein